MSYNGAVEIGGPHSFGSDDDANIAADDELAADT